jgi:hypothetical protein
LTSSGLRAAVFGPCALLSATGNIEWKEEQQLLTGRPASLLYNGRPWTDELQQVCCPKCSIPRPCQFSSLREASDLPACLPRSGPKQRSFPEVSRPFSRPDSHPRVGLLRLQRLSEFRRFRQTNPSFTHHNCLPNSVQTLGSVYNYGSHFGSL